LKAKIPLNMLLIHTNVITSRTSGEVRMYPEAPVAQVGEKSARSCSFFDLVNQLFNLIAQSTQKYWRTSQRPCEPLRLKVA